MSPHTPISAADLADRLRRWEESGATWHVLTRSGHTVTVSLCRCDDGEEVERLHSTDPAAATMLQGRTSSTDEAIEPPSCQNPVAP